MTPPMVGAKVVAAVALVVLACGCTDPRTIDVLDPIRPGSGTTPVFATTTCESTAADGSCNKMTCKEDATSNCQTFAEACIKNDHHYSGTAKEGACSRIL